MEKYNYVTMIVCMYGLFVLVNQYIDNTDKKLYVMILI